MSWLHRRNDEVWATALGENPGRVATLLDTLAGAEQIDGVTVEAEVESQLPPRWRSPKNGYWCYWLLDPADAGGRDSQAIELAFDDSRINTLLAHSNSAHIFAGSEEGARWSGVVKGEELVSVGGYISTDSGAAHLVSICTHPRARGQRLAHAVCNRLIISALSEQVPMIYLEMYAENAAGRSVYSSLGFTECGRYRSGLLQARAPQ